MNETKDLPLEPLTPAPEPVSQPEPQPESSREEPPVESSPTREEPVEEASDFVDTPSHLPEGWQEPPAPPCPPLPWDPQPVLEQLLEQNRAMAAQLASLEELFRKRIAYTDHEEKVGDRMHRELQRYKEDLYFKLIKPVLVDVLEMRDSILRTAAVYKTKAPEEQAIPLKLFSNYAYDLQEILEKNGIEIYGGEAGGDYIPLRQRVVKKLPTTDPELHGKVAQVLAEGYMNGDKVLSPEKVAVYIYEEPKTDGSAQ